jgi:motility quorum-sensing regulator / GCU-specific mRNA interferase toxin
MTDKRMPHHDLDAIKQVFSMGHGLVTRIAIQDAAGLGYGSTEITTIIQTITKGHFYKSMTSNYNASVWQDVYHVPHSGRTLYVKFTDNGGSQFTLLSFKEK